MHQHWIQWRNGIVMEPIPIEPNNLTPLLFGCVTRVRLRIKLSIRQIKRSPSKDDASSQNVSHKIRHWGGRREEAGGRGGGGGGRGRGRSHGRHLVSAD